MMFLIRLTDLGVEHGSMKNHPWYNFNLVRYAISSVKLDFTLSPPLRGCLGRGGAGHSPLGGPDSGDGDETSFHPQLPTLDGPRPDGDAFSPSDVFSPIWKDGFSGIL